MIFSYILLISTLFSFTKSISFPLEFEPTQITTTAEASSLSYDFGNCQCDLDEGKCNSDCECDPDCTDIEKAVFSKNLKTEKPFYQDKNCDATTFFSKWNFYCKMFDGFLAQNQEFYYPSSTELSASEFNYQFSINTELSNQYNGKKFLQDYLDTTQIDTKIRTQEAQSSYKADNFIQIEKGNGKVDYFYVPIPCDSDTNSLASSCFSKYFITYNSRFHTTIRNNWKQSYDSLSSSCENSIFDASFLNAKVSKTPNNSSVLDFAISGSTTTFSESGGTRTCANMMEKLSIYFYYSNSGQIEKIETSFSTKNVSIASTNQVVDVSQSFDIYFLNINNDFANITEGVGNPGYNINTKLLAGRVISNGAETTLKKAIQRRVEGLEIYSGLNCADKETTPVYFGQDIVTSCRLQLTLAELGTLCTSGTINTYFNDTTQIDYIGKFGNSDFKYLNQWTNILNNYPDFTGSFSDGKCSNFQSILNYQIFYAKTGNVKYPNYKIIGVKRSIETQEFQHYGTGATTQNFFLQWRVLFYEHPEQSSTVETIGTGIQLIELPKDTLYPFLT